MEREKQTIHIDGEWAVAVVKPHSHPLIEYRYSNYLLKKGFPEISFSYIKHNNRIYPSYYLFVRIQNPLNFDFELWRNLEPNLFFWLPYGAERPYMIAEKDVSTYFSNLENYLNKIFKSKYESGDRVWIPQLEKEGFVVEVRHKVLLVATELMRRTIYITVPKSDVVMMR